MEDQPNFLKFYTSTRYNSIITNPPFHLRKNENKGLVRDVYHIDFLIKCVGLLKVGGAIKAIIGKASEKNKDINLLKEVGTIKTKILVKDIRNNFNTCFVFNIYENK